MNQKEPNEKELMEILELAKVGEQKLREMSKFATAMAEKWQRKAEARRAMAAQKEEV
ncbi:hypothetical protein [Argonema antarcticum]|uniref:hypothetical protein n=1 Tax=Argonema antarcticum TaxID=2942763 RepID=UPI002012A607|nr:hypothetical protein [Argonema antarcticum]MCL1470117.1 hypothetical protein [Argonema antarcticum A004/B2]